MFFEVYFLVSSLFDKLTFGKFTFGKLTNGKLTFKTFKKMTKYPSIKF